MGKQKPHFNTGKKYNKTENSIVKYFKTNTDMNEELIKHSQETGQAQSKIINDALIQYFFKKQTWTKQENK